MNKKTILGIVIFAVLILIVLAISIGNFWGAKEGNASKKQEKQVITNYTIEEIENSPYLYTIGATVHYYVVAEFNEDYSEVRITKNGEDSDGAMMRFDYGDSRMTDHISTLKSVIIENGVTNIYNKMFSSFTSLESVTLPESVTSIGINAFYGCSSLTRIEIPDGIMSLPYGVFEKCTSLESVTLPESVTSIDKWAFRDCTSLKSITIPDGVTSIGEYAFRGCTSLKSVTIPNSVTSIGSDAFSFCESLENITFKGSKTQWSAIDFGSMWDWASGYYTVHCTDGDITVS